MTEHPRSGLVPYLHYDELVPVLEWLARVFGFTERERWPDAQGVVPELAIAVEVEEAFLHCPKCFLRAKLWDTDEWMPREEQPSFAAILKAQTKYDDVPVEAIAQALAADEKKLY